MTDSKKVWKEIRQLVNLKSRSGSIPTKLLAEDVEINYPKSMADAFNFNSIKFEFSVIACRLL